MIKKLQKTDCVKELFRGARDTCIFSCLQNVMGSVYVWVDEPAGEMTEGQVAEEEKTMQEIQVAEETGNLQSVRSAVAVLGDFSYWAGVPDERLLRHAPVYGENCYSILVPLHADWAELIRRAYGDSAERVTRYALSANPEEFDTEKLAGYARGVPEGFCVRAIDEQIYALCLGQTWSRDFVGNYDSYAHFKEYGLGYVVMKDGEVLAGASSFSGYETGIEIEIVTRTDYRRRGFARICSSNLILECLRRGLYPNWDAANTNSLALAQQLGYRLDGKYFAYERHEYR